MSTRAEMLSKQQVEKGVEALLAVLQKKQKAVSLVEYPDKIDIQFTLKKITYKQRKVLALSLPNSIHHKSREVCLFVKDLDQKNREYEDTVEHYEDIFRDKHVTDISKIVPIKALRTDYSEHSSKRVLAQAYDLYLADGCVFGLLPAILGQAFFGKKRTVPVQVNLKASDLQKEVAKAVDNTRCVIVPTGSCHMTTVAHSWMGKEEIVDNILAAAKQIAEKVNGGQPNIRNITIKCDNTVGIPLLIDFSDPGNIEVEKPKPRELEEYTDEVTTVQDGLVRIRADGYVEIIKDDKADIETKHTPRKLKSAAQSLENTPPTHRRRKRRGKGGRDSSVPSESKKIKQTKTVSKQEPQVKAPQKSQVKGTLKSLKNKKKGKKRVK